MPDFGFDNWMDAQLRNVPLPPDLLSRLAESGAAHDPAEADARLDAALRDVPVPGYLESRLRRIAQRRSPLWRQLALAASLFLVISLGGLGYLMFVTRSLDPAERSIAQQPAGGDDATIDTPNEAFARSTPAQRSELNADLVPEGSEPANVAQVTTLPLPALAEIRAMGASLKQAIDARLRAQSAFGATVNLERLPELDAMESSAPRGVVPPRVPGYDLMFQLKHGEHPFAAPAAHPALLSSRVPFTFRTGSFDLALRSALAERLVPADEIRVEEFLAAQDYLLPPAPASGLALHAGGSASPWGDRNLKLLQLAVQAATAHVQGHAPATMVVVVDISTRMRFGAHWEMVRLGLGKLARQMSPEDRLTLIGFAEQPRVLAQDVSSRDLQALLASDSLPQPAGSANFAAAIEAATAAVRKVHSSAAPRLVFITAGSDDLDQAAVEEAGRALAEITAAKVSWEVVRMGSAGHDSQWSNLALAGQGRFTTADSAVETYDALVELLVDRPLNVAHGVSLKLTFNPQVVTGYRLLGHEASTLTGAAGDPVEIDLHADRIATGLYELWLKPGGGDLVATAELTWREPVNGQSRHVTQPIKRGQFAGTFTAAPPWVQQGIVAAKAAEALRGSYYAPSPHPLAQVREVAGQVSPRVAEQPAFRQLLAIVKNAEKPR